jgi:hypothetical protein
MAKDGKENNSQAELTSFDGHDLAINIKTENVKNICFRAYSETNACVHYTSTRIGMQRYFDKLVVPVPPSLNLDGLRFEIQNIDTKEYLKKGVISYGTK